MFYKMITAISFSNVSKKFLTGKKYYPSLRDWIGTFFSTEFFKGKKSIYALENISFKVSKGESIGLIGSNGAGKSTILKLISKVTIPTSGEIKVNGSVAGLLELGAGFHPELTGRENIWFNATILGMKRNEIEQKIDKIIDFSELGKFIESPVKHYSSGMYARLGFSIAVHVEPDILLVDEVLSVGDEQFRKKSIEKIQKLAKTGKITLVFVSHSMPYLQKLCDRLILIERGKIITEGKSNKIISLYRERSKKSKIVS